MLFPDYPRPIVPYQWHWDFATIVSRNPESGRIQTRQGRSIDLLYATLTYPIRPIADYNNLRAFCRTMRGMATRFTFKDFNGTATSYSTQPVAPWPVNATYGYAGAGAILCTKPDGTAGIGDGSTMTFDLPFCRTTGAVVYVSGNLAANYSISIGTGVDGRDRVVFTSTPPPLGHPVTASCTLGRLTIYARLATDSFSANTLVGGGGPIQPTLSIMQDVM
jgi:hypothetical protein